LTLSDHTGATTTRFTSALASFQKWHNARNPGAPLRTDGVFDAATYQALFADTAATVPMPGPGAVPWAKPNPQTAPGTAPGIHGGIPQLGGAGGPLPANAPQIKVPLMLPAGSLLPPGAVPGFHVAGQPPNAVWLADGSFTTLPPGIQPLDATFGTPPADFVWQGGNALPGAQNLPWVNPAQALPLQNAAPNPWAWVPPGGSPMPTQPAAAQEANKEPAKSSDGALPIAGLLAALVMS
jgi:hypothetical protein